MKHSNGAIRALVYENFSTVRQWHVFSLVLLCAVVASNPAFAQAVCVVIPIIGTVCFGGGGGGACAIGSPSIGDILCNIVAGSALLPTLLAAISYLLGILFTFTAILKTKEHVEQPNQVPLSEPVKRFLAAAGFLSMPVVATAIKNTLIGSTPIGLSNSGIIGAGGMSSGGLDAMLFLLVADIFYPFMFLLSGFGFVAGLALVMVGIGRMLKSAQEGPKGPTGTGTVFTFIVAGVLFSIDNIMAATTGTLFGTTNVTSYGVLTTTTGDPLVDGHIQVVIGSITGFMIIIGLIAFVRGMFIVREVAEGGQASLMAAVSHIIGGAMAVNIGSVINAVQTTFGLNLLTFS
ncbi:MAG: hypothetical protein CL600_00060 [Alteromonas sp.]|nr:hypothetical protein [Alteromonas sp.]